MNLKNTARYFFKLTNAASHDLDLPGAYQPGARPSGQHKQHVRDADEPVVSGDGRKQAQEHERGTQLRLHQRSSRGTELADRRSAGCISRRFGDYLQ